MRRLAFLGSLLLCACGATSTAFEPTTELLIEPQSAEHLPAVVAVMPALDRTTAADPSAAGPVPVTALRAAIWKGLPSLRYAPLSLEFLDRGGWEEASVRAEQGRADALLEVSVTYWDETLLHQAGCVRVAAEVYLFGLGGGDPLWGVRLQRKLVLPAATMPAEDAGRRDAIAALLAAELLAELPERDPLPGG